MERTRQTADIIAAEHRLTPVVADEITELDFGDWMGQPLADLRREDRWKHFNAFRSGTRAPGGELQLEAQLRIVSFMTRLGERHPGERVALVSHGDVIKAAVAYYLGVPLDLFQRIEISTASVSVIAVAEYGPWVLAVNSLRALPEPREQ
jgi:probable phosphoglycerate mutase